MLSRCANLVEDFCSLESAENLGLSACHQPAGIEETGPPFSLPPPTISSFKCLTVQNFLDTGASDFLVGVLHNGILFICKEK